MADINLNPSLSLQTSTASGSVPTSPNGTKAKVDHQSITKEIDDKKDETQYVKLQQAGGNLSEKDFDNLMKSLNAQLEKLENYLKFERDEETEKMVFFIKNTETDEILRQIPTEEFLKISKNISNYLEIVSSSQEKHSIPAGMITHETA